MKNDKERQRKQIIGGIYARINIKKFDKNA